MFAIQSSFLSALLLLLFYLFYRLFLCLFLVNITLIVFALETWFLFFLLDFSLKREVHQAFSPIFFNQKDFLYDCLIDIASSQCKLDLYLLLIAVF